MGVDLRYQGLPPDSGFIELVRSRPWADSSWISHVRHWLQWGIDTRGERIRPARGVKFPWPDETEGNALWEWCCEAAERFPDLSRRSLDVHKSYVWLPFLLSAKVRRRLRWPKPSPTDPRSWNDPESEFDDLVEQAFNGAPEIAPGVHGAQGLPIRLMARNVVKDFGLCVGAMEESEVAQRFVEVVGLDLRPAWDVEMRTREFANFRGFFSEAALRGEDILVIWD